MTISSLKYCNKDMKFNLDVKAPLPEFELAA